MLTIKNHLITTVRSDKISDLIDYTKTYYRPYDPGQYLYKLVINHPFESKFSDKFIELVYTTLISWNMNQRGARLSEFSTFKESLIMQKKHFISLEQNKIEQQLDLDELTETLKILFTNLQLVAKDKPKLVTFSKTLHFFLPNLLMPIDRSYTIKFFYNNTNVPGFDDRQFEMYCTIFKQFREFSMNYNLDSQIDNNWNRNIPKIIDNIIIAYMQIKLKKTVHNR